MSRWPGLCFGSRTVLLSCFWVKDMPRPCVVHSPLAGDDFQNKEVLIPKLRERERAQLVFRFVLNL